MEMCFEFFMHDRRSAYGTVFVGRGFACGVYKRGALTKTSIRAAELPRNLLSWRTSRLLKSPPHALVVRPPEVCRAS